MATRAKAHAVHARARSWTRWRRRGPQVWWIRYHRLPEQWRAWGRRVSWCESRGDPHASNGSHWGRFQWLMSTWAAAGGHGHPSQTSYPEEAVIAIRWAQTAGVSQWACS